MTTMPAPRQGKLVTTEPQPLDQNPAAVYLASLAPGSQRTMRGALDKVASLLTGGRCDAFALDWARLRFQHVSAVRTKLTEQYAASTVNKHLSAIRGTLKAAYKLSQMSGEQYRKATAVDNVSAETEPAGRMLSKEEITALLRACAEDPTPSGTRDAAMIGLWTVAGPRRAEIVALDVSDYNPETGAVHIRQGKGNKDRTIYVAHGAQRALDDWLSLRGTEPGALFVPVHQTGAIRIERMSAQAAYYILQTRAEQGGVQNASPHDLRRTAISNLIDATDLATAQKIAGHSDPKTTARYDRRGERAKRDAAQRMKVAYEGMR